MTWTPHDWQGDKGMVSNIWALHEMAKAFRRDEGDRLLFPMHAVRLLCLAQKDRASDDAKAWMKGLDGQGRWDEVKPSIPDYAYDKHTSQGQAMVLETHPICPFKCHNNNQGAAWFARRRSAASRSVG